VVWGDVLGANLLLVVVVTFRTCFKYAILYVFGVLGM